MKTWRHFQGWKGPEPRFKSRLVKSKVRALPLWLTLICRDLIRGPACLRKLMSPWGMASPQGSHLGQHSIRSRASSTHMSRKPVCAGAMVCVRGLCVQTPCMCTVCVCGVHVCAEFMCTQGPCKCRIHVCTESMCAGSMCVQGSCMCRVSVCGVHACTGSMCVGSMHVQGQCVWGPCMCRVHMCAGFMRVQDLAWPAQSWAFPPYQVTSFCSCRGACRTLTLGLGEGVQINSDVPLDLSLLFISISICTQKKLTVRLTLPGPMHQLLITQSSLLHPASGGRPPVVATHGLQHHSPS